MYVLTELGYVLICQVKEKEKKNCSFENALVEKSESSTRNKNGLVEGLLLFSSHGMCSLKTEKEHDKYRRRNFAGETP